MKYFKSVIDWFRLQFKPEKAQVENTLVDLLVKISEDSRFNKDWLDENIAYPTEEFQLLTKQSKHNTEKLKARYIEIEEVLNIVLTKYDNLDEEMVLEIIELIRNRYHHE